MKASDARNIAENVLSSNDKHIYAEVMVDIEKEAKDGRFNVWHYKKLPQRVQQKLKELGYEFKEYFNTNEYSVNITW